MQFNYKAVFYDWDGCIAKTIDIWLQAYKSVLAEEGIYPKTEEIIALFGNWDAPKILGHSNLELATNKVLEFVNKKVRDVETYDSSLDVIKKLHDEGIKVGIITSSKLRTLTKTRAYEKLKPFVDIILSAEDVINHKPHPEIIQLGLDKLSLKQNEVIMVGDSDKDLGAAKNAGVDSVLFAPVYNKIFHNHEKLTKDFCPTFVIDSHKNLILSIQE